MYYMQSFVRHVSLTVERMQMQHWALVAIVLVVVGYITLRKGHA